jgi:hypothetical protein
MKFWTQIDDRVTPFESVVKDVWSNAQQATYDAIAVILALEKIACRDKMSRDGKTEYPDLKSWVFDGGLASFHPVEPRWVWHLWVNKDVYYRNDDGSPVTWEETRKDYLRAQETGAAAVERPLHENGTNQHTGGCYKEKNITPSETTPRGTSATYRARKLARDHPEVCARLAAGEFKSVAEAERAAGVKPPLPTVQERAMRAAQNALRKLGHENLLKLRSAIDAMLAENGDDF